MLPSPRWRAANFFWIVSWRCSSQSIAAYSASSLASATPKSAANVVVCHQRVVASLVWGASIRAATIAQTRSPSGCGRALSNFPNANHRMATRCAPFRTTFPAPPLEIFGNQASRGQELRTNHGSEVIRLCASPRGNPSLTPARRISSQVFGSIGIPSHSRARRISRSGSPATRT
jgi:hypothetical protein